MKNNKGKIEIQLLHLIDEAIELTKQEKDVNHSFVLTFLNELRKNYLDKIKSENICNSLVRVISQPMINEVVKRKVLNVCDYYLANFYYESF